MNTKEFQLLLRTDATEIAEYLNAPKGQHIYVTPDGKIHLATAGTKMRFAFPVLHFQCNNDLDDVEAGAEVEAWEEWLLTDAIYRLDEFIQYPKEK